MGGWSRLYFDILKGVILDCHVFVNFRTVLKKSVFKFKTIATYARSKKIDFFQGMIGNNLIRE